MTRFVIPAILVVLLLLTVSLTVIPVDDQETSSVIPEASSRFAGGDGSSGNPYQISNVTELQWMGNTSNLGLNFTLVNDIDASATLTWNSEAGFHPVGNQSNPFNGTFDGQEYSITGLTINRSSTDYVGLFGFVATGGIIKRVSLVNCNITGDTNVSGLIGWNEGLSIKNSCQGGNVSGKANLGGLVGVNNNTGVVENCYSTGNVIILIDPMSNSKIGGLVGYNKENATVKNCFATEDISGKWYVGGLVGHNSGLATVENCYATGNLIGDSAIGGLIGGNDAIIKNCYATGTVSGSIDIGGFLGGNWGGTVENSFSTGTAYGYDSVTGGFLGGNYASGLIKNCYSTGNVSRSSFTLITSFGGFIGHNDQSKINDCYSNGSVKYPGSPDPTNKGFCAQVTTGGGYAMSGNFWDTVTSAQTTTAGIATGKTTTEMMTKSTFTGWDFDNIWTIEEGKTYPLLGWFSVNYTIRNLDDLQNMRYDKSGDYILANDIDASPTSAWNSGAGFIPIGTKANPFTGHIEGVGFNITSLYINRGATERVGLLGNIDGSRISNLSLIDVDVLGQRFVGGLIGVNDNGRVMNCTVSGNVSGVLSSIGGLIGSNDELVADCSFQGNVSGGTERTGGLIGSHSWGIVTRCWAIANVSCDGEVGGLIGYCGLGKIIQCYSQGEVTGDDDNDVGGLIGFLE